MAGHVHSIESFGTVDGPGVRLVVFLKGCPMRCLYCHNPDTWDMAGADIMTVDEIIGLYEKNQAFYSNGGITLTGGEPLVQIDFVIELFAAAKKRNIHTCLDTSGVTFHPDNPNNLARFDRLAELTDLVLLDIKHMDPQEHITLCGQPNDNILAFARYLDEKEVPVWIRHVIVPGYTYEQTSLFRLGQFIGSLHNVKALDVLPYHDMGKVKYESLGMDYPLKDVKSLGSTEAAAARKIIVKGMHSVINSSCT